MDRSGSNTFYRGEVNDELVDKVTFRLFERNVLDMVFIFEESGKTPATQTVILVGEISTIFIDTFEEVRKVFVEGLQQAAVIALPRLALRIFSAVTYEFRSQRR